MLLRFAKAEVTLPSLSQSKVALQTIAFSHTVRSNIGHGVVLQLHEVGTYGGYQLVFAAVQSSPTSWEDLI